jgi:hypothetical protein
MISVRTKEALARGQRRAARQSARRRGGHAAGGHLRAIRVILNRLLRATLTFGTPKPGAVATCWFIDIEALESVFVWVSAGLLSLVS